MSSKNTPHMLGEMPTPGFDTSTVSVLGVCAEENPMLRERTVATKKALMINF